MRLRGIDGWGLCRHLLRGADGGEDAHKAEVGKEPREEDGEAQEGAEFGKKLQVAGEKRQRRLRHQKHTHTHGESVSWCRVPLPAPTCLCGEPPERGEGGGDSPEWT